ncbi:nuclear polyadenylated RNA-binding protein 3-like [Nicotiana tomentosiformis]|uniref:nuclear polyadenylated RNA-binding protein 3-like n=1 Tax=Nicotiana tomentosiformis TaxID=4098 RepID=UPI00388CCE21
MDKTIANGLCWTKDEEDYEGEKEEELMTRHEEHDAQNIANEEEKSENEGVSRDEKESDTEDKTGEHANNSAEEENQSEEEEVSVSESEGGDDESEEEEGNVSEKSEGSMTIGNTERLKKDWSESEKITEEKSTSLNYIYFRDSSVIAPLKEIGEGTRAQEPGSLLTPFTRDEETSSDEDDMPLSKVGKNTRKTTVKATKTVISTRK